MYFLRCHFEAGGRRISISIHPSVELVAPKPALAIWACHKKALWCRNANLKSEIPVKEKENADTDYFVTAVVRRRILWV